MTKPDRRPQVRRITADKGPEAGRYAPAQRLHSLRTFLNSAGGASIYDIAERFDVSARTAIRYLEALRRAGEPLFDQTVGKRKVWRLVPTSRTSTITLSASQMMSLFLSRRVFDFLDGTGFKEDLDDVFAKLEATIKKQDTAAGRNLDRKIYDVNEAPHIYQGRSEHVNAILTGLLKEQRLAVVHDSVRGQARFEIDPYTLLVYKKGLYLAGYSHRHHEVRTFALDGFSDVEWLRGQGFEYPKDFHPARHYEGAFGIIGGAPVHVRIRFSAKVARYVTRRRWHPSQRFKDVPGGVEMEMDVRGATEVLSWVLGFGKEAEVIAPAELRDAIRCELELALANYPPGAR